MKRAKNLKERLETALRILNESAQYPDNQDENSQRRIIYEAGIVVQRLADIHGKYRYPREYAVLDSSRF